MALPALPRAQKLQKRAARVGFDWSDSGPVLDKLQEEIVELREALSVGSREAVQEEMGDILFTCANLARHLKLDAEHSLRHASAKFENRFTRMEALAAAAGGDLSQLDDEKLDQLWEQAKAENTRQR